MLLAFSPREGNAHRVNIFAFADGNAVQIECSFSKSQRVRNGRLTMSDAQTGEILAEARTDEQGLYRYIPDGSFLTRGHGLKILLNAGEGHQSSWILDPEELRQNSGGDSAMPPVPSSAAAAVSPPALPQQASMSDPELKKYLEDMLEAKLAPVRQMLGRILAAQQDESPRLRDIIGGIGWIIGLLGLAAYMRNRKC